MYCIYSYLYNTYVHKSTHDRPLTGVHWPVHRGWFRGSGAEGDLSTSTVGAHRGTGWRTEAVVYVTARGLDNVVDSIIHTNTASQQSG